MVQASAQDWLPKQSISPTNATAVYCEIAEKATSGFTPASCLRTDRA